MKRFFPLVIVLLMLTASRSEALLSIKLGTFNPRDAKAGFIVGLTTGRQVDERVDFGLGADLFMRRFTQQTEVDTNLSEPQSDPKLFQTELSYSMYALPLMVHLDVRLLPDAMIVPYVGLAGGYELVFSREANYMTGQKDSRLYGGFGWQLMVGGEYPIGSASALLAEVLYNGCTVSRSEGSNEAGYPTHVELDFSGFGFRLGFRLGG